MSGESDKLEQRSEDQDSAITVLPDSGGKLSSVPRERAQGGDDQVTHSAEPASTAEALRMLSSAMGYLAAADPTAMSVQAQADCLLALERLDAVEAAARAGARREDLAALAMEIYARSLADTDDDGHPEQSFEDRQLRLETTIGGAGVISGDLTPECAAVVTTVLESLSAPMGAEDTRTRDQRYHDALQEAMRRLIAGGLLPERAGQPVKVWAHISLAELRAMDDGSVLQGEWISEMRVRWAARRAAAVQGGSDGAAWLDGDAARAVACDATVIPVVTGEIDPSLLDDLVHLCVELAATMVTAGRGIRPMSQARHPTAAAPTGSLPGR
jgi:Domain of unknown function (DUF222)